MKKHINYTEHLRKIRTNGYFSLLCINHKAVYTKEIRNIFIIPNNILKRVYIHDKEKKLIPHKFLKKLFQTQIGYPKNFANLNLALAKIMKWYSDRGYQWSLVEIQQTKDPSSLIVNIHEGLVKTITIEYYTFSCTNFSNSLYMKPIEQYLDVRVGIPLNINYLQKKINYLKDNQLVGNIVYSVERSKNDLTSLDIKFQIQELRDKEVLVLADTVQTTYPIISHTYDLLGQYNNFSHQLLTSNIISLSASQLQGCYFNTKTASPSRYINTSELIQSVVCFVSYRTSLVSSYFNLQTLLRWTKKNTIGFQIYLRNLSRSKSFCVLSLKFIQNELNIKVSYLNPALIINQNFSFQFVLQIIKQYNSIFANTQSVFLTKIDLAQFIIESIFVYRFTSCFSISEKILLSRAIHKDSLFYNSENLCFHTQNNNQVTSNCDIFKQNTKLFYQEFLTLLLSLRYQNFNHLGWPLKGHLFEVKSLYFAPFQKSNFLSYHFLNNYKNLFFHKIFVKEVSHFSLPIYFTAHLNHILVSTIKCQSNLSTDTVSLLLSNNSSNYIFNFSTKVRIDYLVPITNNTRLCIFYNYLDCFLIKSSKRLRDIYLDLRNHRQIQSFLLEKISCGFGIQFKLPIRQMPPLSVEYTVNSRHHFCIYLHIYYPQ